MLKHASLVAITLSRLGFSKPQLLPMLILNYPIQG